MRIGARIFASAVAITVVAGWAASVEAKCTRLAFSVNDYGKDGPTKDAKQLLDKYVAEWTAKNGIKNYTIGKKDVSCELFLDFGVFDEHTCKASALVCWPGQGPSYQADTQAGGPAVAPAKAKAATSTKAAAPIATGTVAPAATPAAVKKVAPVAAPALAPAAAPVVAPAAAKAAPANPIVAPVPAAPAAAPAQSEAPKQQ